MIPAQIFYKPLQKNMHCFLLIPIVLFRFMIFLCDHRDEIKRFIISSVNVIVVFLPFLQCLYLLILLFENIVFQSK